MFLNTKSGLDSVKHLTEVARSRFSDEEFGGFFYRSVSKDIEETDFLLDCFVQFLAVSTPLRKRGTVHRLMEEALKKHQVQLVEKGIRLSREYEKDLPETTVPDSLLSYILDSVLQYGIRAVTPGGEMEFSTKSSKLEKDLSVRQRLLRKDERCIQIELLFKGGENQGERFSENSIFQEDPLSIILLRLVEGIVRKNHGIMELRKNEKQASMSVSLWFPCERRETVYYQPNDPSVN